MNNELGTVKPARLAGWYVPGAWLLLLLAAIFAYWPGLSGPFLFDDFAELGRLGSFGGIVDWESFRTYVLGGTSGPTGRPVALLSFLVDGTTWPADPWPFKRTNLLVHLLTASVLGVLTQRLLCVTGRDRRQAAWIALVAAGAWLLHPFLVSTSLYAVQRMAQLATLFALAGLLGYLHGRLIAATNPVRGYAVMTLSLVVFTTLATLSKENGALLPVLAGVLEITVLASSRLAPLDKRWSILFLAAPAVLIGVFLVNKALAVGLFNTLPPRDFSIYERLLTQPRVLSEYLGNWFIPKLYTTGVFQDHVVVSRGLLAPPATLFHLVAHSLVIATALLLRRRFALPAFALLFFYSGHLVESTTINLEIYFEHRNYLPAAFLFVPLVTALRDHTRTAAFVGISVVMFLVLGSFTRYSSTVWSDYTSIVEASARKAPMSARAQAEFAKNLFNNRQYDESLAVIDAAIERHSAVKPQLVLTRLIILCKVSALDDEQLRAATAGLSQVLYDRRLLGIYEELALSVMNGECPLTTPAALHGVFASFLDYPLNANPTSKRFAQIQYFMGLLDSRGDRIERAVQEFEQSLRANPSVSGALNIAAILATGHRYVEALAFVDKARDLLRQGVPDTAGGRSYSASDIDDLETSIRDAQRTRPPASPPKDESAVAPGSD